MLGLCLHSTSGGSGGSVIIRNTSSLYKTGADTTGKSYIYLSNDDGVQQRGNGVDWFTLSENNVFGNDDRFTDKLGGQTYSDNVVLVHSTDDQVNEKIMAVYLTPLTGGTLKTYHDAQPYTLDGHNDWVVPNETELHHLIRNGFYTSDPLNYPPFNFAYATYGGWWTDTSSEVVNRFWYYLNSGRSRYLPTLAGQSSILIRYYTYTELGL